MEACWRWQGLDRALERGLSGPFPSRSGHELSCSARPLRPSFQTSVKHLSLDSQASWWLSLKTAPHLHVQCIAAPPVWPRLIILSQQLGCGGQTRSSRSPH